MAGAMSKTQINKLGDRLRQGNITEADLRLLDEYRRTFTDAYEVVIGAIRKTLGLEPTGRPAKSTTSISDKLRRESIRLTQIQDIAGCRLIVSDIAEQERVVQSLNSLFEHTAIIDRRQRPSHGYRAVHVIVECQGKLIEIQVRTSLQHLWAELSEKFSDVVDPAIKYGGGNENIQAILTTASADVSNEEVVERVTADLQMQLSSKAVLTDGLKQKIVDVQDSLGVLRQRLFEYLRLAIDLVEKGEHDAISD
ncbi:MAG: hypothetical protein ACJ74W_19515 [Pyrinomonadaceae bacterium]